VAPDHGDGAVDAYVRQIIVREFLSQQRRWPG
jgi:hypothetical protein